MQEENLLAGRKWEAMNFLEMTLMALCMVAFKERWLGV